MKRRITVRRWGAAYYVVFRCCRARCETVWRSSYFQGRAEAEAYASNAPKRGWRARCQAHRSSNTQKGTP